MGAQLAKEVIPLFEQQKTSAQLLCIGIGTHERSLEFCQHVGFPSTYLYSDPENKVYDALKLVKSTPATLFTDVRTPLALAKRFSDGKQQYLSKALSSWASAMWIPPRLEQGLQQGGAYVLTSSKQTLFKYKDPSAGAHVDVNDIVRVTFGSA